MKLYINQTNKKKQFLPKPITNFIQPPNLQRLSDDTRLDLLKSNKIHSEMVYDCINEVLNQYR